MFALYCLETVWWKWNTQPLRNTKLCPRIHVIICNMLTYLLSLSGFISSLHWAARKTWMILITVSIWGEGSNVSTECVSINRWSQRRSHWRVRERVLNGNGSGIYLLQFWTKVTEPDRGCFGTSEFSIGDMGRKKKSGLSCTLQINNPAASQKPSAPQQATVWGTSRRGQLEAGVVSVYWPLLTGRAEETEIQRCECVATCQWMRVRTGVSSLLCDV